MYDEPMTRRGSRLATLVLTSALASACIAETTYVPERTRRATLVMRMNQVQVYADGEIRDLTAFASTMRCDEGAADDAREAQRQIASGRTNEAIVGAMAGFAWLVPVLAFVAIPFAVIAGERLGEGTALTVDAINRYNDSLACTQPEGV